MGNFRAMTKEENEREYSNLEKLVKSKGRELNTGVILLKCVFVPTWDTFPECWINGLCIRDNKLCFQVSGTGYNYENDWCDYRNFSLNSISFNYPSHNGRRITITYDNKDIDNFLTKLLEKYK